MENTEEKSPSQILNEAANLLEEEDCWNQGSYFKYKNEELETSLSGPACSMCAHGAIAYCGDPKVKKNAIDFYKSKNFFATPPGHLVRIAPGDVNYAAAYSALTVEQYIYKNYKGNIGVAHYRALQVGLTFAFNDMPGRTKKEVVDKLREAANL